MYVAHRATPYADSTHMQTSHWGSNRSIIKIEGRLGLDAIVFSIGNIKNLATNSCAQNMREI
jgi:hypothetical protein